MITSVPLDTPGLIGEYLRHGDAPPAAPRTAGTQRPDVAAIAADLARQGISTVTGVSGRATRARSGDRRRRAGPRCGCSVVHAGGPEAHVERHLQLRRAGWQLREVFDTKWADRRAELAIELAVDARE